VLNFNKVPHEGNEEVFEASFPLGTIVLVHCVDLFEAGLDSPERMDTWELHYEGDVKGLEDIDLGWQQDTFDGYVYTPNDNPDFPSPTRSYEVLLKEAEEFAAELMAAKAAAA
jgi:hypothetical protein